MAIGIYYLLTLVGMAGGVLFLGFYYVGKKLFLSFWPYDVEIEHISGDGKARLQNDFAKRGKVRGVDCLKTFRNRDWVSLPPKGGVCYSLRGRKKIHLFKFEDDTYVYAGKEFTGKFCYYAKKEYPERNIHPLTTAQRNVMIIQHKKAAERITVNRWMQLAPAIGGSVLIIIVLVLVFAFWENLYKPAAQAQEINQQLAGTLKEISQNNLRVTQLQYEIQTGKQVFFETEEAPPPVGVG